MSKNLLSEKSKFRKKIFAKFRPSLSLALADDHNKTIHLQAFCGKTSLHRVDSFKFIAYGWSLNNGRKYCLNFNPLKPNSSSYYTVPHRPNLLFLNFWHSGTLVLSRERQNARISEIKNGRLGLYGAEHLKFNHMMTLGFKGLSFKSNFATEIRPNKSVGWPNSTKNRLSVLSLDGGSRLVSTHYLLLAGCLQNGLQLFRRQSVWLV